MTNISSLLVNLDVVYLCTLLGKISTQSPPNLNFMLRIRVNFKIMARFRVRVRVKDRVRVSCVYG